MTSFRMSYIVLHAPSTNVQSQLVDHREKRLPSMICWVFNRFIYISVYVTLNRCVIHWLKVTASLSYVELSWSSRATPRQLSPSVPLFLDQVKRWFHLSDCRHLVALCYVTYWMLKCVLVPFCTTQRRESFGLYDSYSEVSSASARISQRTRAWLTQNKSIMLVLCIRQTGI